MDSREQAPHQAAPHLAPAHIDDDEPPPLLRTWPRLYALVVCYLACLIVLFYVFSRLYNS